MPACIEGDPMPCALEAKPITHNLVEDIAPSWSPDSHQIAFASDEDGLDTIFIADLDGSNLKRLTAGPKMDTQPAISPDGSKLAIQSNRDGNYEIYVLNLR